MGRKGRVLGLILIRVFCDIVVFEEMHRNTWFDNSVPELELEHNFYILKV